MKRRGITSKGCYALTVRYVSFKKKSENHSEFGMHDKSFADAHCSEITMSKYLKVAPGGLFSGLVQGLLLFGRLKKK